MTPKDLVMHAIRLAVSAPDGDQQDVELRRAISAGYYSLYHQITGDAASTIAPNVDQRTKHRIQRWFEHAQVKQTCGRFLKENLEQPLRGLIGQQASPSLMNVCRTFVELQEARHAADYDMDYTVDKARAMEIVRAALLAQMDWTLIAKSHEANIFILSLLMWKNWDRERL